jgi:hypothetical protein
MEREHSFGGIYLDGEGLHVSIHYIDDHDDDNDDADDYRVIIGLWYIIILRARWTYMTCK